MKELHEVTQLLLYILELLPRMISGIILILIALGIGFLTMSRLFRMIAGDKGVKNDS